MHALFERSSQCDKPGADARGREDNRLRIIPGHRVNVLYIIDQLCEMGGAERVLLNMIRLLPRDRFRPRLLTFKTDPALHLENAITCAWDLLPLRRTWDLTAAGVAWQLNRLIHRERIDVVHTFFETSDIWAGPIARVSGARVLVSSRRDMGILRTAKHRLAYRLVNSLYDQIQTVSEQVRQYSIANDGLAPEKVITLYNGVAAEQARNSDPWPAIREATHVITTVAHIRHVKGIDILLRTASRVRREFPGAHFVVIGENHEPAHYTELLRLREELALTGAVHFTGPTENVFGALKASSVFCLPSRSEGLSNALLEAMACSVPCVATSVGGNLELIESGTNGILVPVEDDAAMASAILSILRDPTAGKRMGAAGRHLIETRFTTEAMMQQLVNSYEHLLGKSTA